MLAKKLFIYTIGCQMNVYESEKFERILKPFGYDTVKNFDEADLVIVNTCSIREKAEEKAFSFLGRLIELKKRKKDMIVCAAGCVAQQEGKKIIKRMGHVDIVLGTHASMRLPDHIQSVKDGGRSIIDTEMLTEILEPDLSGTQIVNAGISNFVTIMQGCENFCTYCVVPYVRGKEISRKPDRILDEIKELVSSGAKEVTLLGQNVNSYGEKEGLCSFVELLNEIHQIQGLHRIRFATSHPKDLSDGLIYAIKNLDKLCNHIHLPVQSGSNNVLKRMNRKYTREKYLERIGKLKQLCPDVAVTSDMIVGFPGETSEDFQQTLDLVREVEFDGIFAFSYSDRPMAPALKFSDKVSDAEKSERLQRLFSLQEKNTLKKNLAHLGKIEDVLVEGLSKKQKNSKEKNRPDCLQWTGRIQSNKVVNFSQTDENKNRKIERGMMVQVKIDQAFSHSLQGTVLYN